LRLVSSAYSILFTVTETLTTVDSTFAIPSGISALCHTNTGFLTQLTDENALTPKSWTGHTI
jgi:hypothetical protein